MHRKLGLGLLLVSLGMWGCSGEDASANDGDGDRENAGEGPASGSAGSAGTGGSGGGDGASSGCGVFDYVFEPAVYGSSGDVIRELVVVGDWVYFKTLNEAYRVPVAGGEPELVDVGGAVVRLYEFDESVALLAAGGKYWTAPAGGEPALLTTVDAAFHGGIMLVDGQKLYSLRDSTYDSDMLELQSLDLLSGEVESLRSADSLLNVVGWNLVKSGEDFFFSTEEPLNPDDLGAERDPPVMNVWREGKDDFEVLWEVGKPQALMADGDYVYFHAAGGVLGGVSRMPLGGGEPQQLIPGGLNATQVDYAPSDSAHIFLSVATLYAVDKESGTGTRFGCLPTKGYTYHALATEGDTAYVSVFHSSDEMASIARIALP